MVETNGNGSPSDTENKGVKEFKTCPVCGSGNRMFEQMGKELRERGLTGAEDGAFYELRQGGLVNEDILAKIPIGGKVPAFIVATDVCLDCGSLYAVKVQRITATKVVPPVQLMAPGGQGFRLPGQNNPLRN